MNKLPLLHHPIDAIVFDCDSTLSKVEGVDELAKMNNCWEAVHKMTNDAMSDTGVNNSLYRERLELVQPTYKQMCELGKIYYEHRTDDICATIDFLTKLDKKIFIISAGLLPPVVEFGKMLGIAESAIYAVDIYFDEKGNYKDYEENSLLTRMNGKRTIISELMEFYPKIIHIGDGLNDIEAKEVVTRFIGYGGVAYRENIAKVSDCYVTHPSMLSILPLCLTHEEVSNLEQEQFEVFQQGVKFLQQWSHVHE